MPYLQGTMTTSHGVRKRVPCVSLSRLTPMTEVVAMAPTSAGLKTMSFFAEWCSCILDATVCTHVCGSAEPRNRTLLRPGNDRPMSDKAVRRGPIAIRPDPGGQGDALGRPGLAKPKAAAGGSPSHEPCDDARGAWLRTALVLWPGPDGSRCGDVTVVNSFHMILNRNYRFHDCSGR